MTEPVRLHGAGTRARADRAAFLRDGYVVARGVLDPAALEAINAEMGELFALQLRRLGLPVDRGPSREAWQANAARLLAVDVETYINTARMTQMLPSAHRLMAGDAILALVRDLGIGFPVVSTRLSNHIMSEALRIPGGYHKSPPHQDWRSMQGSLDSVVLWAPTTPVSEASHPLQVVPRSHLMGLLDTVEHIMTPTVSDPRITEDSYLSLPMQPGDVVAFSSFLVHRTGEAGDGLVRIAFSTRYNNAEEPTYVEHGYPTPYKYSYRTDLMVPDFPKAADIARIFPDATGD
ncbi:MAG TPA: phytanoyl-CoA dioxygenase family protein [Phenylobacterium sp.]|jgi:phytanoyl-CoA hydroxylase|uniref:phytanoyl-CoA dioxygenase family protein n=1 Tax=Phenylobacterium sp. TaxID=1871053 RepID=UPI002C723E01|nr:phytanoyl-CoA dioxygenase family protein [Phenylobacterium sp.]HXA41122.1 phytanoyl-CoA dioxygenase family protein [Phenylobacterium sp.]